MTHVLTEMQARRYSTATQWANVLSEEFANQGMMEQELRMETCLFGGPPELGNVVRLGTSQVGFMDIFAIPLFRTMSLVLPGMKFTVDEIQANKAIWERTIEAEKQRNTSSSKSTASAEERAQAAQSQRGVGLELTQSARSSSMTSSPSSRETSGGHKSHFVVAPDSRKTSLGLGPPATSASASALQTPNTSVSTSRTSNVLAQPYPAGPTSVPNPVQVDGMRSHEAVADTAPYAQGGHTLPRPDRKNQRKFSFKFWRKTDA